MGARATHLSAEVLVTPEPQARATAVSAEVLVKHPIVTRVGLSAIIFGTLEKSFGLNAVIREPLSPTQGQHDRATAHFATQDDTVITVGEETLHEVLERLFAGVAAFDDPAPNRARFGLSAFIQPHFSLSAVLAKAQETSFGLDARIAYSGSFGLSSIIRHRYAQSFGLSAHVVGTWAWNVVRTPMGTGTASYSAISQSQFNLASDAADGIQWYEFSGDGWEKNGSWAAGDWWQVSWDVPQTINRVILYGPRQTDGSALVNAGFGSSGRLVFSDGSTVNWTGWTDPQLPLTVDFPKRMTTSLRVISDVNVGGTRVVLAEVEAFNTEQYG